MSESVFHQVLEKFDRAYERSLEKHEQGQLQIRERGIVTEIADGVAHIRGLPRLGSQEVVKFPGSLTGMALNLDRETAGVVLLGDYEHLRAGMPVQRTNRVVNVPVGDELLGRVISPTGRPMDNRGTIQTEERQAIEQPAPAITHRKPVKRPLQTGIKAVDALLPLGCGQRELIVGDRQTGKTAIAIDTILNQRDSDVICVYCAIGQEQVSIARTLATLENYNMRDRTIIVVATGDDVPGMKYIAPYSATTMAEYFMRQGQDVLIIYDDLTHHARAYRELSLLLRRPPGREAYPGDIFYVHSRLLERATQLNDDQGGGSLTALPIVETQAQNLSAYIPTNLISITDGQIYLSPDLFQKGILPAIDVGRSVSRVGGKAQRNVYQEVAGDLRLSYSQFEELETFSRFGTRLDEETRQTIERGRRVREILRQPQYQPVSVPEQVAAMLAVTEGLLDDVALSQITEAEQALGEAVLNQHHDWAEAVVSDTEITDEMQARVLETMHKALEPFLPEQAKGDDDAVS